MLAFACFLILELLVSAETVTTKDPYKSVNLALETVIEFDTKDNSDDLQFLDNVQQFITKVRTIIDNNKDLRRVFRGQNDNLFTTFLQELINIILTYEDSIFKEFLEIFDEEIRKYHYRGCKFYELIENIEIRKLLASSLEYIKRKEVSTLKKMLDAAGEKLNNELYDNDVKDLLDYINSLYKKDGKEKFEKVLTNLERFNKSKRKRTSSSLVQTVRDAIRSIIFDHYTELNPNARRELVSRLEEFIENKKSAKRNKESEELDIYIPFAKSNSGKFKRVKLKKKKNNEMNSKENLNNNVDRKNMKQSNTKKNNKLRKGYKTESRGNKDKINSMKHKKLNVHVLTGAGELPLENNDKNTTSESRELSEDIKKGDTDGETEIGESSEHQTDEKDQTYAAKKKATKANNENNTINRNKTPKKSSYKRQHFQTLWVEESTGGIPKSFLKPSTATVRTKKHKKQWIHGSKVPKQSKREEKLEKTDKQFHHKQPKTYHLKKYKPIHEISNEEPFRETTEREQRFDKNEEPDKYGKKEEADKYGKKEEPDKSDKDPVEKVNKKYFKDSLQFEKNLIINSPPDFAEQEVKEIDKDFNRVDIRSRHRDRNVKYDRGTKGETEQGNQPNKDKFGLKDDVDEELEEINEFTMIPVDPLLEETTFVFRPTKTTLDIRIDPERTTTDSIVWSPLVKFRGPIKALPVNTLRSLRKHGNDLSSKEDMLSETQSDSNESRSNDVEERMFEKLKNIEEDLHEVRSKIEVTERTKHRKHKTHEKMIERPRKHKIIERKSNQDRKHSFREHKRHKDKHFSYEENKQIRNKYTKKPHHHHHIKTNKVKTYGTVPKTTTEAKENDRNSGINNTKTQWAKNKQKDHIVTTPERNNDKYTMKENGNKRESLSPTEKREIHTNPGKIQNLAEEREKDELTQKHNEGLVEKNKKYTLPQSTKTTTADREKTDYPEDNERSIRESKSLRPSQNTPKQIEEMTDYHDKTRVSSTKKIENYKIDNSNKNVRSQTGERQKALRVRKLPKFKVINSLPDIADEVRQMDKNFKRIRVRSSHRERYAKYDDEHEYQTKLSNNSVKYIEGFQNTTKKVEVEEIEDDNNLETDLGFTNETENLKPAQNIRKPVAEENDNMNYSDKENQGSVKSKEIHNYTQEFQTSRTNEAGYLDDHEKENFKQVQKEKETAKRSQMKKLEKNNVDTHKQKVHSKPPKHMREYSDKQEDFTTTIYYNTASKPADIVRYVETKLAKADEYKYYNSLANGFGKDAYPRATETDQMKLESEFNLENNDANIDVMENTQPKSRDSKNNGYKEVPRVKLAIQEENYQYDGADDWTTTQSIIETTISTTTASKATPATKSITTSEPRYMTTENPQTTYVPFYAASKISVLESNTSVTDTITEKNKIFIPVTEGIQEIASKDLNPTETNITSGRRAGKLANMEISNLLNSDLQQYINKDIIKRLQKDLIMKDDEMILMKPGTNNEKFGSIPRPPGFNDTYDLANVMLGGNYGDVNLDLLL